MSYFTEGQLTTDKENKKLVHMVIIPFPVWAYAAGNTTYDYDQLKTDLLRVWKSLLFWGQLITDTNNKNLVHMLIILFPVCAYAAIYYGRWRVLVVFHLKNTVGQTYKQEME